MKTPQTHRRTLERSKFFMLVRDHKKLAKLMIIQDATDRDVAAAAGWKAHSYVSRIRRGEVKTLRAEPALRIAQFFGVPLEDLFLTRLDSSVSRNVPMSSTRKVAA